MGISSSPQVHTLALSILQDGWVCTMIPKTHWYPRGMGIASFVVSSNVICGVGAKTGPSISVARREATITCCRRNCLKIKKLLSLSLRLPRRLKIVKPPCQSEGVLQDGMRLCSAKRSAGLATWLPPLLGRAGERELPCSKADLQVISLTPFHETFRPSSRSVHICQAVTR